MKDLIERMMAPLGNVDISNSENILSRAIVQHAVPLDKWPIWAKGLKLVSNPDEKGIGDVIARIIGTENSEAFKKWYRTTFGKDCGCTGRQATWNALYPL